MSTKPYKEKPYLAIDNYIYLYHTNTLIILPGFPDDIQDNTSISWGTSTSLGRSAPIYSYQNSGPRTMQITLAVHRESVNQMNYSAGHTSLFDPGDDYVDVLIKQLQAAALPTYAESEKMVDPPIIACRFGDDIFIKGVVNQNVGVTFEPPILRNGKLAKIQISFGVSEIDAYDATMVSQIGSYRDPGDIKLDTLLDAYGYSSGGYGGGSSKQGGGMLTNRVLSQVM